jgi:ADP-ribose pyrophosphatase YjhB (NUDIX family)
MTNITIPASYLILIREEKILLLRRFNTAYEDGNYSVIAGHVEKGESFTQCIIRESQEEAGIALTPEDLEVVHVMHRDSKQDTVNQRVDVFFTARKWVGEITNMEPEKCDDLSWFDFENLPSNIIPYIRDVIDRVQDSVFYSEDGWD